MATDPPLDSSLYQSCPEPAHANEERTDLGGTSSALAGKPALTGRTSRPPKLTWNHPQEADATQSLEGPLAEKLDSGPGSPVSPISCVGSEISRTPNVSDRPKYAYKHPSSPGATSPLPLRLHSPASQIFERSVQEDIVPLQASPSIPAHIRTENYIPSVLEASSAAITDEQLDPDSVEIVTHSVHQPAALAASANATAPSTADQSLTSSGILEQTAAHPSDIDEVSSTYGASDIHDIRRLSFISFADVVNAEHAETNEVGLGREPQQGTTITGYPFASGSNNRSPSPLLSPASSHALGTSPPTSITTSVKGLEMSPNSGYRAPGSPLTGAHSPMSSSFGGELNVETMRQALRRTGSGDLGALISQGASNLDSDEPLDRSF